MHFFRPVLEIASAPGTELKTITFDLGADGHLGVNPTDPRPLSIYLGPITSATVVYTGSLTLPEITEANGFYYTGTGTGTLGWYDGTTFYAPGTAVNLVTGTTLTAGYGTAVPTPSAPQNLTATPGNGQVVLSWSAPVSDGGSPITKYEVSKDNGTSWTDADSDTGHTFTGLSNGVSYTFQVRAVNSVGPGAAASVSATPQPSNTFLFLPIIFN